MVTIWNSALFTLMLSFRGKLNDQRLPDVLAYVRSVAPSDSVS
jgi:hypothetical protein